MTSALVVAVLLSGGPPSEVDGHAVFAKARQTMLGGARLPWLLLASGSIARSDDSSEKASERFVLEWEPCERRDVRGYLSRVAEQVLDSTMAVLCRGNPIVRARVDRNGSHVQYVWDPPIKSYPFEEDRVTVQIDPEQGLVTRARLETRWQKYDAKTRKPRIHSRLVGTAELSDFKPIGTMRLPHRLQLQAGSVREDWTIERIEIVPLP
jgi:hypothetical protein